MSSVNAHFIGTHLLVPRASSSAKVKVKYKGHISQKMAYSGAISVSQTQLVDNVFYSFSTQLSTFESYSFCCLQML